MTNLPHPRRLFALVRPRGHPARDGRRPEGPAPRPWPTSQTRLQAALRHVLPGGDVRLRRRRLDPRRRIPRPAVHGPHDLQDRRDRRQGPTRNAGPNQDGFRLTLDFREGPLLSQLALPQDRHEPYWTRSCRRRRMGRGRQTPVTSTSPSPTATAPTRPFLKADQGRPSRISQRPRRRRPDGRPMKCKHGPAPPFPGAGP